MNTPWGTSQTVKQLDRGLSVVSTASHGGIMVAKGFAEKNLSKAAIKQGHEYGEYYAYEEDCASAIVIWELPKYFPASKMESIKKSLSTYYADYLVEKMVVPTEPEWTYWKQSKLLGEMRAAKNPNLIVSASKIDNISVKLTAADGKQYKANGESYRAQDSMIKLLSMCKDVKKLEL